MTPVPRVELRYMGLFRPSRISISIGVAGLLVAGGLTFTLDAQQPPSTHASAGTAHVSLIDEYCLSCHDEDHKKGNLVLETVAAHDVAQHPEVWEKVVRKLRARQMPPVGKPRPDEATYDAVVGLLTTALDRAAAADPNPGRTDTVRRLTRSEYQNAIRDLLAIEVDLSSTLPRDESSQGFDNITVT